MLLQCAAQIQRDLTRFNLAVRQFVGRSVICDQHFFVQYARGVILLDRIEDYLQAKLAKIQIQDFLSGISPDDLEDEADPEEE